MTTFDGGADTIVARARADAMVCQAVERLRLLRFCADPAQFETLLWLAIAQGVCLGARLAVADMQLEIGNGNA